MPSPFSSGQFSRLQCAARHGDELVFAALEEHAIAGAVVVDGLAAALVVHGQRALHARAGGDDGIALLVGEQVAEHHDARVRTLISTWTSRSPAWTQQGSVSRSGSGTPDS
jgi:hypothetical protein